MSSAAFEKLVLEKRIIVCCGAGGVGKTTTSGAAALAAARAGRRVLVLTIDPSKRLAQALGVDANPPEPVRLDPARLAAAGALGTGTLDAWMLDPKRVADDAVRLVVKNDAEAEKLFQNRIYQNVTAMVAGMHEYTAMQALHRFVREGRYDLVVLDTPPSRHALDFLEAPGRLSRFLDGRVFRMFLPKEAESGGLRRMAGGVVSKVLGTIFGEQFSSDLAVFFGTFAGVLTTLGRDVGQMREFLSGPDVAFILVTSPAAAALEEALFFQGKTRELGLPFKGFVLNRSAAAGAENRVRPTREAVDALLGSSAKPLSDSTLERLRIAAEAEASLIARDELLTVDLQRRAGPDGFVVALPSLPHAGGTELEQLVTLSREIYSGPDARARDVSEVGHSLSQ